MKVKCPFCQAEYEINPEDMGQKFLCTSCQKEFEVKNPKLMPCPDCCGLISKRAAVCPRCGAPLSGAVPEKIPMDIGEEEDIMLRHPSAMNYLWPIVLGALTSVIVVGLFILLYVYICIRCTTYRITNRRIIVQRGWLAKTQTEIWIKDMRGANLQQSIWQRIINVGNISIGTAATAGAEIFLCGIGDPQKVVDTINSLR